MKYSELKRLIEEYETWEQMKLGKQMPGRVPNDYLCNGEVQFASIENVTKNSSHDLDLPIVVGVGINYGQCKPSSPKRYTPHAPYLGHLPSGRPCVEDNKSPNMRIVLNETFDAYESNPQMWVDRYLASHLPPLTPRIPRDYFLVATNFSPFITFQEWQKYVHADRAQVLAALDGPMQHLDDLLAILGREVLWVGHGLHSEVFALFRLWQERNAIPHWLLTANLSSRNRGKIRAPHGEFRFWNKKRPEVPDLTPEEVVYPTDGTSIDE